MRTHSTSEDQDKSYDSKALDSSSPLCREGNKTRWITIEPLMFSITFITTCTSGVTIDVIERNLFCWRNNSICDSWSHHNELLRKNLNAEAAQVNMVIRLVQGICPFLISMFIGPWSDMNGRKPFMVLTLIGYLCYSLLWTGLSLFSSLSPYAFVVPSIPLSVSGGQLALYVCCYCYVCDSTDPQNRTVRFSMMHSSAMVGNLMGTLCVILVENLCPTKDHTYIFIFSSCSLVAFLGVIYALFYIKETVVKKDQMDFLFNLDFPKSIFKCLLEKSSKDLIFILLTAFILFFDISIKKGERVILYLVGLEQFAWSLSYYNIFSMSIIFISAITSSGLSILLKEWLGWHNLTILLFAAIMVFSSGVLRASSATQSEFWITSALATLTTLTAPAVNGEVSSLVTKEDMGKIYAFNALVDSLVPFLAVTLYSEVYRFMVPSHHVLYVYFLSAALAVLNGVSSVVLMSMRISRSYSPTH